MEFYIKTNSNVEVVIFHDTLTLEIKKYLLPNLKNVEVIDPSKINLHLHILYLFLLNIFKIQKDTKLIKFLFLVYQYSTIEHYNPVKVITFIDNSSFFQWLSQKYNHASFYAIQNGNRSKQELLLEYKNNLTTFFTFGEYEKQQYKKYGHNADNFIPVGSFRSAIFQTFDLKYPVKYDICLVSQHKTSIFHSENELRKNLELIDIYLNKFLIENKDLTCIILCRYDSKSTPGKFEHNYFKSIYGDRVVLQFQDASDHSTYKGMMQSKLVVSCFSTCASEAMAWDKKVLFCDYSLDGKFADFEKGIWLLNNNEYGAFSERMHTIISMDNKRYNEITFDYFEFVMSCNESKNSIDKIKSVLF
jgi:surface carbohydrate biosynthesis protein